MPVRHWRRGGHGSLRCGELRPPAADSPARRPRRGCSRPPSLDATVTGMPAHSTGVLIIGGGAAGLMCAIEAGRRGRSVVVIEHNPQAGRKILISGGGRCNFTNLHTRPEHFLSANPHFAKSALARYTPRDFLDM